MGYQYFTACKLQNRSSRPSPQEMYSLSMEERQEAVKTLTPNLLYCIFFFAF